MQRKGEAVASLVSRLRDDQDMSDAELAQASGLSVDTVQRVTNGSVQCPTNRTMTALAVVLPVSLTRLQEAATEDGCGAPAGGNESRSASNALGDALKSLRKAREAIEQPASNEA